MKRAASILLIAVLVAVCAACGQNRPDGSGTDNALESTAERESIAVTEAGDLVPSSQDPCVDTVGNDAPEESEVNPVLSENQSIGDAGAGMDSSPAVESQLEMAGESTPSLMESSSETSTTEEIVVAVEPRALPGGDGMYAVNITVGNEVFPAKFYDNASARVLIDQMPMTLDMRDYAGQEKVLALDYDFPSATKQTPPTIRTGDIYLYSGSSLVLFYTTFSNSYSYVPIGYVEETTGLASALGDGNVMVAFLTM